MNWAELTGTTCGVDMNLIPPKRCLCPRIIFSDSNESVRSLYACSYCTLSKERKKKAKPKSRSPNQAACALSTFSTSSFSTHAPISATASNGRVLCIIKNP